MFVFICYVLMLYLGLVKIYHFQFTHILIYQKSLEVNVVNSLASSVIQWVSASFFSQDSLLTSLEGDGLYLIHGL